MYQTHARVRATVSEPDDQSIVDYLSSATSRELRVSHQKAINSVPGFATTPDRPRSAAAARDLTLK